MNNKQSENREDKRAVEQEIMLLIEAFEERSGLRVAGLDLRNLPFTAIGHPPDAFREVHMDVRL